MTYKINTEKKYWTHYYKNHKNIKDVCRLIHFNCLIGENNKINKMKELNEWFL